MLCDYINVSRYDESRHKNLSYSYAYCKIYIGGVFLWQEQKVEEIDIGVKKKK